MGLQVWLPLNGNVNNQGIASNLTFQSLNATVSTSGKIGSCYSFNATNASIDAVHDKSMWRGKPVSYALWFKSDESKAGGTILEIGADLCVNYTYADNLVKFGYWRAYKNTSGNRGGDRLYSQKTYDSSKWHHIAITFNSGIIKLYVDGTLDTSWDRTSLYTDNDPFLLASNYNRIALGRSYGSTSFIGGLVNDLRIYDHCLSLEEVKWISQGLTLHYPLSNRGFGCDNLLKNSQNIATTGSDGTNKPIKTFDTTTHIGRIEYVATTGLQNAYTWITGNLGGASVIAELTTGQKTYTYAIDVRVTNYTSGNITAYIDFRNDSGTPTLNIGRLLTEEEKDGNWHRITATATTNNTQDTRSLFGFTNSSTPSGSLTVIEYKNPKLEVGSIATPWVPNSADTLYSALQLGSTAELDCSGYQYNGTKNGTLVNAESPINQGCYVFNGTDSWIRTTADTQHIGTGDFSISAWINLELSSKTYQPVISNKTTGAASVGCAIYFNHSQNKFLWSTADGSGATEIWTVNTFADIYNKWTHVVMVRNSSDAKKGYFYINGVRQELASVPAIRNISTTHELVIGALYTDSTNYRWTGKISDVRMYATALSEDAIKELYMIGGGVV